MDTTYKNPNSGYFQSGQGGNPYSSMIPSADLKSFQTANPGLAFTSEDFNQYNKSIPQTASTIDVSTLGQNTPSPSFPTTPTTLNSMSLNTGVAQPIASAESIIEQGAIATPAEQKQQSILDKVANLIGGNKTKTTIQNEAEQASGVASATSAFNDLNTQLEGLNNQALALQNEAQYTIPNASQNSVEGKGVTTAGLAPLTASQLRSNQIKQGAIATQALTVKSALFGAQGKLALAKDAADKAATAQYEVQQQQIDFQKAQLEALMPTLNKEEKKRASIQQAKLADRQAQIDNAKEDKKTILAMATAALKNNPNNPQAQYAAQQALAESNKEQPNLQVALGLVGQYQQDPLDIQAKIESIALSRANKAKIYSDIAKTDAERAKIISETVGNTENAKKQLQNNEALGIAKELLKSDAPGKKSAVGASLAKLVPFGQSLGLQGDRSAFDSRLNTLKASLTLDNLKLLKGSMSDKDILFLNSIGSSLTSDMNETEFNTELNKVIKKLEDSGATYTEQGAKQVSVTAPDGVVYNFPDQASADAFKRSANIK